MITLREARVTRMLTIRGLAEAAKVSPATVHLAEVGQRMPHFGTMQRIASVLGMEPHEIVEFRAAMEAATRGKEAA